jgi:hypothetical protein
MNLGVSLARASFARRRSDRSRLSQDGGIRRDKMVEVGDKESLTRKVIE